MHKPLIKDFTKYSKGFKNLCNQTLVKKCCHFIIIDFIVLKL